MKNNRLSWLLAAGAVTFCAGLSAQEADKLSVTPGAGNGGVSYRGDDARISIGIDDEGDVHGEYLHVFGEDENSNWIGELWASDSRGGAKLNYHWLSGASSLEAAETAQDGVSIGKAFIALDQNEDSDRKLSFGLGLEGQSYFWGAYLSAGITGRRQVAQETDTSIEVLTGLIGNQQFEQNRFTDVITTTFERPYDYGVGLRLGRWFDNQLFRLRGGLDYEEGEGNADQLTFSIGVEKFFANTPHSLALRAEHFNKSGDFEVIDDDTRAILFYRYNFGQNYQPARTEIARQVEVTDKVPASKRTEQRPVQNRIEVSDEAYFDLDKAFIRPDAASALDELALRIGSLEIVGAIRVVGHTCDLGETDYNQGLSERRAKSAAEYLSEKGLNGYQLVTEGRGELQPKYPNDGEPNRRLNRRVVIEFISLEEGVEDVEIQVEESEVTRVEWVKEPITDPAWMRRALRNPIQHKRTVDTYRTQEVETVITNGEQVIVNTLPEAADDEAVTDQDVAVDINVLANDNDADGDVLTIVNLGQPQNGTVTQGSGGIVTYTPAAGFFGTDTFDYTVEDANGQQSTATVTVTVIEFVPPPLEAINDVAETVRNQPVAITLLGNDVGEGITLVSVSSPSNGQVEQTETGVVYTPNRDFVGEDSFTYQIRDEFDQVAEATVQVTVGAANINPVATDDEAGTRKNVAVVIDVLANDFDADGDALTIVSVSPEVTEFGTVSITDDNQIRYTPNPGWWGGDQFTYTIEDGFGGSATATVMVTVLF